MTNEEFKKWWYTEFKFRHTGGFMAGEYFDINTPPGYYEAELEVILEGIPEEVLTYLQENHAVFKFNYAYSSLKRPHSGWGISKLHWTLPLAPYNRHDYMCSPNYLDPSKECYSTHWTCPNAGTFELRYYASDLTPGKVRIDGPKYSLTFIPRLAQHVRHWLTRCKRDRYIKPILPSYATIRYTVIAQVIFEHPNGVNEYPVYSVASDINECYFTGF